MGVRRLALPPAAAAAWVFVDWPCLRPPPPQPPTSILSPTPSTSTPLHSFVGATKPPSASPRTRTQGLSRRPDPPLPLTQLSLRRRHLGRPILAARRTLLLCSPHAAACLRPPIRLDSPLLGGMGFGRLQLRRLRRFISDAYPSPMRSSVSWMDLPCSRTTDSSSTSKDARHRGASLRVFFAPRPGSRSSSSPRDGGGCVQAMEAMRSTRGRLPLFSLGLTWLCERRFFFYFVMLLCAASGFTMHIYRFFKGIGC